MKPTEHKINQVIRDIFIKIEDSGKKDVTKLTGDNAKVHNAKKVEDGEVN